MYHCLMVSRAQMSLLPKRPLDPLNRFRQTHRHTDHGTCDMRNKGQHLCDAALLNIGFKILRFRHWLSLYENI